MKIRLWCTFLRGHIHGFCSNQKPHFLSANSTSPQWLIQHAVESMQVLCALSLTASLLQDNTRKGDRNHLVPTVGEEQKSPRCIVKSAWEYQKTVHLWRDEVWHDVESSIAYYEWISVTYMCSSVYHGKSHDGHRRTGALSSVSAECGIIVSAFAIMTSPHPDDLIFFRWEAPSVCVCLCVLRPLDCWYK